MKSERKFLTCQDLYLLGIMALIKIVERCGSPRVGRLFARGAAFAAWRLSTDRKRARSSGLAQALAIGEVQAQEIVKNCFHEFWHNVFSLPCYGGRRSIPRAGEVRGLEHLQKALAQEKGVILWESNSFGKRLLAKRILQRNGVSVAQVHGQHHLEGFRNSQSWIATHVINPFFENCERRYVGEIIYLSSSEFSINRTLVERLKRNRVLCIAADGRQGHKFVAVQFLGSYRLFPTGMVSLAKLSGAAILPVFCIQRNGGEATVIIEPPIKIDTSRHRERALKKSVTKYAGLLESYVRRHPEQYLNWEWRRDDQPGGKPVVPRLTA
jgi:lauroyl/myristoyl acyltransferase